ncbi:hypothetical protein TSAR_010808 [Trichomalopsis sarcophagae]|uniref:peptidyl-tRNA hydrolase n=1 Tax=Trichomalopsis sarcophagae TaxID=543379 RepID=A0A232EUE4_9HYME|nr:hypothetical protein TSAR_010808 [Trichomalopsis sarcophagae]
MEAVFELLDYLKSTSITIPLTLLFSYGLYKVYRRKQAQPSKEKEYSDHSSSDSSSSIDGDMDDYFKLVLVVRNDLKMGKGKVAAQCAHAAVAAYKLAKKQPAILKAWEYNGQTKITLKCETEAELMELHQTAKAIGLLSNVVRDAGQTQVAPGSRTVCGIGPGPCELIDQITGHLKLY